jgi:5-methylcytosine-specific restriction endonuclease McrA
MIKVCAKCGSTEFNKRKECLSCKRAYTKMYDAKNREALILKKRERYESQKAELQAKAREYYSLNKSERVQYASNYRVEKADTFTTTQKKYRDENKERRNAFRREYTKKFPEKMLNYNRKRMNRIGSDRLSDGLTSLLMLEQGGKCAGCVIDLNKVNVHLDHFMPIKLGGRNIDENIQLLCKPCNQSKSAKHPTKWLSSLITL